MELAWKAEILRRERALCVCAYVCVEAMCTQQDVCFGVEE